MSQPREIAAKMTQETLSSFGELALKRCPGDLPADISPYCQAEDRILKRGLTGTAQAAAMLKNARTEEAFIVGARKQLIGLIISRDPAEYEDSPQAAIYLADDILRLFDVKPKQRKGEVIPA